MRPRPRALRLYGVPSDRASLEWAWVDQRLTTAGIYWVVACPGGHPHPRPVWGVWRDDQLHLSLGSPTLLAAVRAEAAVTVHLDSGTDVVIVEGHAIPTVPTTSAVLDAYDRKYDWKYEVTRYGNLTTVQPEKVLAWQAAGPNGRDSFQRTGCWLVDSG